MATRWLVMLSRAELVRVDEERNAEQVSYYTLHKSRTIMVTETRLMLSSIKGVADCQDAHVTLVFALICGEAL